MQNIRMPQDCLRVKPYCRTCRGDREIPTDQSSADGGTETVLSSPPDDGVFDGVEDLISGSAKGLGRLLSREPVGVRALFRSGYQYRLTASPVLFWTVGTYLIICRVEEGGPVDIVAVTQGSRDIPSFLRRRLC